MINYRVNPAQTRTISDLLSVAQSLGRPAGRSSSGDWVSHAHGANDQRSTARLHRFQRPLILPSLYQKRDTSPMQTSATDTMPSFDRLLVATDFSPASQAAFRTALETCTALGASLVILHVFEYAEPAPPETGGLLIELQAPAREMLRHPGRYAPAGGAGRRGTARRCWRPGIAPSLILDVIAGQRNRSCGSGDQCAARI